MAFIPTPDTVKVDMVWGSASKTWTNTLWLRKAGFDVAAMNALYVAMNNVPRADFLNHIHTSWQLKAWRLTDMRTDSGPVVEYVAGLWAGTGTGDPLPLNLAFVVTLRTALRGRSYRGRLYFTGYNEASMDAAGWLPAVVVDTMAQLEDIIAEADGLGWVPVVRSTQHNGVPLTTATTQEIIERASRGIIPGTQRRRLPRP